MADGEVKGREGRGRSLLSLARTEDGDAARPAAAAERARRIIEASERHRVARARREASVGPLIAALAREAEPENVGKDARQERHAVSSDPQPSPVRSSEANAPRDDLPPHPVKVARPDDTSDDPRVWKPLIDPMAIYRGIVGSSRLILLTTVAGAAIGVMIALSTPKTYQSTAEILVDPRDLQIVDRNLTSANGLPPDATLAIVENQVRVLTSGTVLNKVVDTLNLTADPEFNGTAGGGLRAFIADLRGLLSARDSAGGAVNRRALSVENLAEALTVERGGKTFVISVSARTKSAEKSALIANTLTKVFLETYGSLQSDTADRASSELTGRLDELRTTVEAAERKVETFKAENDLIDAQGRLITDDEIVKLNDQLTIARAKTLELNARAQSARNLNADAVVAGALPEQISSAVLTELRSQYATLKQEADRASVRLGPRHPQKIALEAQLAGARDQIAQELRLVASSIQVDLKRAVQLEQDLASRLAQVKARQTRVSEELVTLRELEREAAAKRAVYEAFLLRARETGEQRDINTANMSVISEAYPALEPSGASRAAITIGATMMGFLLGVGLGGAWGAWTSLRGEPPAGPGSGDGNRTPQGGPTPPAGPGRSRRKALREKVDRAIARLRSTASPSGSAEGKPAIASAQIETDEPAAKAGVTSEQTHRTSEATAMYPYPQHPAHDPYAQQAPGYAPQPAAQQTWPLAPMAPLPAQAYAQPAYAYPYAPAPQPMPPQAFYPAYAPAMPQPLMHPAAMMAPAPGYWHPAAPQMHQMAPPQHASWAPAPQPAYAQPAPQAYAPPAYPQQPQPRAAERPYLRAVTSEQDQRPLQSVDEIRESLREFRDAVRDFAETRALRREA